MKSPHRIAYVLLFILSWLCGRISSSVVCERVSDDDVDVVVVISSRDRKTENSGRTICRSEDAAPRSEGARVLKIPETFERTRVPERKWCDPRIKWNPETMESALRDMDHEPDESEDIFCFAMGVIKLLDNVKHRRSVCEMLLRIFDPLATDTSCATLRSVAKRALVEGPGHVHRNWFHTSNAIIVQSYVSADLSGERTDSLLESPSDVKDKSDDVPRRGNVHLIVQFYQPRDDAQRADALASCLQRNLENEEIDFVHVLSEDGNLNMTRFFRSAHGHKLRTHNLQRWMRFSDAMAYANEHFDSNDIVIVANADIYFGASLANVRKVPLGLRPRTVLALLRWDIVVGSDGESARLRPRTDCQDSWIFFPRVPDRVVRRSAFEVGFARADNVIARVFYEAGYDVVNTPWDVVSYHVQGEERGRSDAQRVVENLNDLGRYVQGPSRHVPLIDSLDAWIRSAESSCDTGSQIRRRLSPGRFVKFAGSASIYRVERGNALRLVEIERWEDCLDAGAACYADALVVSDCFGFDAIVSARVL